MADRVAAFWTSRSPDEVRPADVVLLHRAVCSYPDYITLLSVAPGYARRALVYSQLDEDQLPIRGGGFGLCPVRCWTHWPGAGRHFARSRHEALGAHRAFRR